MGQWKCASTCYLDDAILKVLWKRSGYFGERCKLPFQCYLEISKKGEEIDEDACRGYGIPGHDHCSCVDDDVCCTCHLYLGVFVLCGSHLAEDFNIYGQVKAKTMTKIHPEAEKNLGLHPSGFSVNRPGSGDMMPWICVLPGTPGSDSDNWEIP